MARRRTRKLVKDEIILFHLKAFYTKKQVVQKVWEVEAKEQILKTIFSVNLCYAQFRAFGCSKYFSQSKPSQPTQDNLMLEFFKQ